MSLFTMESIKKLQPKELIGSGSLRKPTDKTKHVLGKSLAELNQTIGDLVRDESIQFSTGGRWSMHQLLLFVLQKTGPSKIWMTTWTISEDPMRAILGMIQDGLITELNAVFDYRIEKRKPEAFQLASNLVTNIKLTKCHAKVLVIRNDHWDVTVVSTSNFSKNPRIEAGVIFTDKASADFHQSWIDDVIAGKEVFRAK